jgi:hypothetical protein
MSSRRGHPPSSFHIITPTRHARRSLGSSSIPPTWSAVPVDHSVQSARAGARWGRRAGGSRGDTGCCQTSRPSVSATRPSNATGSRRSPPSTGPGAPAVLDPGHEVVRAGNALHHEQTHASGDRRGCCGPSLQAHSDVPCDDCDDEPDGGGGRAAHARHHAFFIHARARRITGRTAPAHLPPAQLTPARPAHHAPGSRPSSSPHARLTARPAEVRLSRARWSSRGRRTSP